MSRSGAARRRERRRRAAARRSPRNTGMEEDGDEEEGAGGAGGIALNNYANNATSHFLHTCFDILHVWAFCIFAFSASFLRMWKSSQNVWVYHRIWLPRGGLRAIRRGGAFPLPIGFSVFTPKTEMPKQTGKLDFSKSP